MCYSLVMFTAYYGVTRKCLPLLWAGALTIVPFLPASNVFFPVGTIVGERLLYLTSVGFCLGIGYIGEESWRRWINHDIGGSSPSRNSRKTAATIKNRKTKPSTVKIRYLCKAPFTAVTVLVLLLSVKTVNRGIEWRTERSLFESALKVCPSSLKVLNNLALVLLDKENARRAGELLDRALNLHPNYPSALFNKGLVHHLFNEDILAQESFEKSLFLEVHQPKTRAYLSQVKMSIGFEMQVRGGVILCALRMFCETNKLTLHRIAPHRTAQSIPSESRRLRSGGQNLE